MGRPEGFAPLRALPYDTADDERPVGREDPMYERTRWLPLLFTLSALLALACSGGGNPGFRSGEDDAGPGGPGGGDRVDVGGIPDEPCIAGSATCYDTRILQVCQPDGYGYDFVLCPDTEDGQPQNCDEASKACMPSVCNPGAFIECQDAKTSFQCNESGTAEVELPCDGCVESDGDAPFPCLCKPPDEETGFEGGCAPLVCRPDTDWACLGDEERHVCNSDGTDWVFVEDCNEGRARICEVTNRTEDGGILPNPMARCISLCEEAQKLRSYIGCEYWGADLDNAFLRGDDPTGYYDAQGKQYAVVVSNPSGGDRQFTAEVCVRHADGPVACKGGDDWGPPFPHQPYTSWCYRNDEACETGPRCEVVVEYDAEGRRMPKEMCLEAHEGGQACDRCVRVPPGELRVLNLPRADLNGTMIGPLGYQIMSDVPITAYQFNPLENEQVFSNDASLLLPINALGKDYVVMSREQTFEILRPSISVIAVRPGKTNVVVRTSARTLPGPGIEALNPGQQKRFELEQFDILNLETNCPSRDGLCTEVVDPTGSQVYADKLIAVFGGTEASNAPNTNHCIDGACWDGTECDDNADCGSNITCCADHLEQQLFPVAAWGRRYVAAKAHPRGEPIGTGREPDVWRVVAGKDGTEIRTIPHQVSLPDSLDRGEWVDFDSTEDFEIVANKAVLVGQFLAAEHAPGPNVRGVPEPGDAETGDPAFILGVPVEQYREDYVFLCPDKYEHDFANFVVPKGSAVLLDGEPLPRDLFADIADADFAVLRLAVDDGIHRVSSVAPRQGECSRTADCEEELGSDWRCIRPETAGPDDVGECEGPRPKIGVVVYGYDQYVSYGYPGGLNLKRINKCQSDEDCPPGAVCCTDRMPCAQESLGECIAGAM